MKVLDYIVIKVCPPGEYARRVISRSQYKPKYLVPCAKPKGQHPADSKLECDAHIKLNAMSDVRAYRSQPAVIEMHFIVDGQKVIEIHYPDLLVHKTGTKGFIEVKPEEKAKAEDVQRRTDLLIAGVPSQGFTYELWTEKQIYEPAAFLRNAEQLMRLGRGQQPNLLELENLRLTLLERGAISWGEARAGVCGPKTKFHVCRLLMDGVLEADLTVPLTDRTLIRWAAAEIRPPPIG